MAEKKAKTGLQKKKEKKKISLYLSLDDLTVPFRQLKGLTEQVT